MTATSRPTVMTTDREVTSRAPGPRRHLERHDPRAAAGAAASPFRALRDGAAAGLPRPVRAAAAGRSSDGSALQWFVPGIIAMTALMGASFTGANLTQEIVTGSHERLLVSPLSPLRRCWSAARSRRSCRC